MPTLMLSPRRQRTRCAPAQFCSCSSCNALAADSRSDGQSARALRGVTAQVAKAGNTLGLLEVGKDNLRRIIGPQGSVIKGLEADSNCRLSIDDAGLVHIYSPTEAAYQTAVASIEGITGASIKVKRQKCTRFLFLKAQTIMQVIVA